MKRSTMTLLAAAAVLSSLGLFAADENGAPQRAAANHFAARSSAGAPSAALSSVAVGRSLRGGKHNAQMLELSRPASSASGIDLVHAPRPITASKEADLDVKWRANATSFQVAPIK